MAGTAGGDARSSFREWIALVFNYVGQLRPYSYADLCILFLWLHASAIQFIGCSALWFGFLVHLEVRHQDRGRARWHPAVWVALWLTGLALLRTPVVLLFFFASIAYSLKKLRFFGPFSSLFNGLVKTSLVLPLLGATNDNLIIVMVVMTIRNLMGDFRDAQKDSAEGLKTLPVILGYRTNTPFVYPATLAMTTLLWGTLGHTQLAWVGIAVLVQIITYRWTPR